MQSLTQVMYEAKAIYASVHVLDIFFFLVCPAASKKPSRKKIKVNQTALSWDEKQDEVIEPSGNAA